MTPAASTALLALAWFAAVNVTASSMAALLSALALRSAGRDRGGWLLAIRLMPGVVSLLVAFVFFAPSHWMLEPEASGETFGAIWYGLAAVGAAILARGAVRAVRLIRAESSPGVDDAPNSVALVGILDTRVVVGSTARSALTDAELDVAIAHELAHRAAFDNVKRCLIYCVPDVFALTGAARRLEGAWRAVVETTADARAVGGDATRAVNLASAIVKVARLGWKPARAVSPAWSLLHEPPLLERRVRRLVEGAAPSAASPRAASVVGALLAVGLAIGVASVAVGGPIHELTEMLVRRLP